MHDCWFRLLADGRAARVGAGYVARGLGLIARESWADAGCARGLLLTRRGMLVLRGCSVKAGSARARDGAGCTHGCCCYCVG